MGLEFCVIWFQIAQEIWVAVCGALRGKARRSAPFPFKAAVVRLQLRVVRHDRVETGACIGRSSNRRQNQPLFIELAYLTEGQRHAAACRFQPAKCPVVGAFRGKLGDDDITRINVFRVW